MTLDEAIKHAEEVADLCEYEASKYDMSDSYESHVACQEGKCAEEHRQLAEWLKELKQLREQTTWIPVSERLPEDGTYFVTVERIVGRPNVEIKSFAKDLNKVDEFDFPKHKYGWYDYDSEYGYWEDTKVIAWTLPLKPYEPQEGSDKE